MLRAQLTSKLKRFQCSLKMFIADVSLQTATHAKSSSNEFVAETVVCAWNDECLVDSVGRRSDQTNTIFKYEVDVSRWICGCYVNAIDGLAGMTSGDG